MINKKIRELEDGIISLINESDVPIEVKRLVLADVIGLVTKQADNVIMSEINEAINEEGNNEQGA